MSCTVNSFGEIRCLPLPVSTTQHDGPESSCAVFPAWEGSIWMAAADFSAYLLSSESNKEIGAFTVLSLSVTGKASSPLSQVAVIALASNESISQSGILLFKRKGLVYIVSFNFNVCISFQQIKFNFINRLLIRRVKCLSLWSATGQCLSMHIQILRSHW